MPLLEERVDTCITIINSLHDAVARTNWATLNRQGFVFELQQNTKRIKDIYLEFTEINRDLKLLLEKNTPELDTLLSEIAREITILDSNISMEQKKKLRSELVNEKEILEVPELYSSLQQKILSLSLKMRYNADKVKNFLLAKKTPFIKRGSTAKNLLEALQQKEDELNELKKQNVELKRKTFFGTTAEEKSVAEIEVELNEMDKKLDESVSETKKSLKTHLAQINYVEGSFIHLKNRVDEIEGQHSAFTRKAIELIKELKKERDFAKTLTLEVEHETITKRSEYTKQLLELEEKKQAIEEKYKERYEKEAMQIKKQLEEKTLALKHANKLVDQLEEEIQKLKQ
jgi:chromosome segregation ATPase